MNRTTKLTLPHASPGTRIVYLFLFFLGGLFVSGLFLILLSSVSGLESGGRAAIYTGTILQSVVAFIIPSYLAVRMGEKNVWSYFKLKRDTGMTQKMALGVSAFIVSYVCVSFLNQWNQSIVLPESLRAIENWMRSLEDSAMQTTHLLLSGETILHLILNLVIIAALATVPAGKIPERPRRSMDLISYFQRDPFPVLRLFPTARVGSIIRVSFSIYP